MTNKLQYSIELQHSHIILQNESKVKRVANYRQKFLTQFLSIDTRWQFGRFCTLDNLTYCST